MWLKEIDNKLVPPPVNYIVGDLTILNFNLNEQAMLDNGWRDWTPEEIAAWEALHPVPEPPTPVVPYYTKSETDEQIAEAIGEIPPQVQSDWDESDSEALSYIQNKPEIPAAQVQSDWDESDSTAVDYIKNKPTKFEQEQADWDESDSSDASYIRNKPDLDAYMPKAGGRFTGTIDLYATNGLNADVLTITRSTSTVLRITGSPSIVIGTNMTIAPYSYCCAMGNGSACSATFAVLTGTYLSVPSSMSNCVVCGTYNSPSSDAKFQVGNGTSNNDRRNAFTVTSSGDVTMSGDLTFTPAGASEATTLSTVITDLKAADVQADWDESDSSDLAYIQNKPTIPTTASEVGAMKFDGLLVEALTSATIPAAGKIYTYTPAADTTFVFPTPDDTSENLFEIDLTMPDPAVTVTWPSGLIWKFATPTLSAGSTTALRFRYTGSSWEGWTTPDMSEYLPLSGGTVTGRVKFPDGLILGYSSGNPFYLVTYHAILTVSNVHTTITNDRVDINSLNGNINITPGTSKHLNFRGHAENTAGGFCISDATTGNLTLPGVLTSAGTEILTPSTTTISPSDNKVYQHTLADADVLTIDTSALTSTAQVQFELHLIQPASPVTFTLPAGVWWADAGAFASGNAAPTLDTANTLYCLVFRWDGANLLGNLAYSKAVTA